ncbi:MAG: flagellar protein FlgN [Pigmentiphaga sp.]|nr:flagellar protein FlgN [Pigmentiphaga sp.]
MPVALLHQQLETELESIQVLAQLLHDESNALLARAQPQVLANLSQRKTAMFERLQAQGQERDRLLAQLGHAAGQAGTDAAADAHPDLQPVWQALRQAAAAARDQNERNGVYIHTHLRYTTEALAALREAQARTALYGPRGRQAPASPTASTRSHRA